MRIRENINMIYEKHSHKALQETEMSSGFLTQWYGLCTFALICAENKHNYR